MGSRGPQKTPTVQLALVGSHRAKSREGKEPKPKQAKPSTSIKLTTAEKRVFNKTYDMLKSMRLHAASDGNALARYAKNVVLYNAVQAACDEYGETVPVVKTINGEDVVTGRKRSDESRIRNELESTLLRLEREFGLTPSARAGLQVEKPTDEGFAGRFIG